MTKATRPILLGIALSCLAAISTAQAKDQLILAIGGEPEQGFDPLLGWGQYGNPLFQSTLLSRGKDFSPQPALASPGGGDCENCKKSCEKSRKKSASKCGMYVAGSVLRIGVSQFEEYFPFGSI